MFSFCLTDVSLKCSRMIVISSHGITPSHILVVVLGDAIYMYSHQLCCCLVFSLCFELLRLVRGVIADHYIILSIFTIICNIHNICRIMHCSGLSTIFRNITRKCFYIWEYIGVNRVVFECGLQWTLCNGKIHSFSTAVYKSTLRSVHWLCGTNKYKTHHCSTSPLSLSQ